MTKEELRQYVDTHGNESKVVMTVKKMHAEGAPMTIAELDRRMNEAEATAKPAMMEIPMEQPSAPSQPVEIPSESAPRYTAPPTADLSQQTYEPYVNGETKKRTPLAIVFIVLFILGYVLENIGTKQMALQGADGTVISETGAPAVQMNPLMLIGLFLVLGISLASTWILYERMDEPGWASIIPFYNIWVYFRAVWGSGAKMFLLLIPFFNIYYAIRTAVELGVRFNKSTGFKIGLVLLSPIFQILLAFDDSRYNPPIAQ